MDEIHPEVNKLEKLRRFKLRSGMIDILSDSLSNLRELQEIDLSQNGLLYIEPGTFAHMSKLTHLHLERNILNDSIWEVINEVRQNTILNACFYFHIPGSFTKRR